MLPVLLALAAQAVSGKLPPAPPVPPPSGAEQVVLGQIEQLFAAFQAGDSAAILRLVHSDGRVTGNGTLSSRTGLRQESWAQFAGRAKPGDGFQETITDPAIEVDGDIAMVWAPFVVRVNGKVSNCGFDHFDLVRENGAWKVMNLTFSSRITGCPPE